MTTAHATAAKTSAAPKAAPPVMRAPAPLGRTALPPLASLAAIPAGPVVQRECAACEAEDKEPGLQRRLNALASASSVQRQCAACEGEDKEESSVQPRLDVGPVGDRYEMEADSIAAKVMAMRDPDVAASAASETVQRACSACSSSREEPRARRFADADQESDLKVRAKRTGGGESIAASDAELTSGGSAMPAATRTFFEDRMGRDLGHVRIHSGSEAQARNDSISARAFTYKNHVWLGAGESASPTFTMAHELAHVMQQTSPGPVGPQRRAAEGEGVKASDVVAAVQRRGAPFWLPAGTGTGLATLGLHTAMHNAALKAIRTQNPDVISEVPIPGANRKSVGPGECGFADLYTTKGHSPVMVPGVEETPTKPPAAPPAGAGAPASPPSPAAPQLSDINNFSFAESLTRCKDRIGSAMQEGTTKSAPGLHESRRAPKIVGNKLDMTNAPTDIRIGEMKPAHDLDYRDSGVAQINNYIAGIKATADKTNSVAQALGLNVSWTPNAKDIGGDLKPVPGWDEDGAITTDWKIKSLKIRSYVPAKRKYKSGPKKGKTYNGIKAKDNKQGRPKSQPIRGKWMMAPDPARSGLFVYFLAPNPDDLKLALGTPSTRVDFRNLSKKVGDIQADLIASPQPTKLQPRRKAGPAVTAKPAPAAVMRKEVKDDFKAAAWEARRTGAGLAKGATDDSLLAQYGETAPDDLREEIADHGAMAEWLRTKPPTDGVSYSANPQAEAEGDLALLKRIEFWTSWKAKPLGILRQKFGRFFGVVFKKVHDLGESIQKKFKGKTADDIMGKGPRGTMRKAAAKIASVILPRIAKPFLANMYNTIVECAKLGFQKKFTELVEGTPIDDLIDQTEELNKKVHEISADVEKYVAGLVKDTVEPIHKEFDDFIREGSLAFEVAKMVADLAQAARVGSCLVGLAAAPETVGVGAAIGCGAALGDLILKQFGLSPVEWIIARTLENCTTQNQIGAMMAASSFIKSLPRKAGIAIVTKVKTLLENSNIPGEFNGKSLGVHASGLFCNPSELSFPEIEYKPLPCGNSGDYRRSKTGKYEIPDDFDGYYKPKTPTPEEEKPWMGTEIPSGREGDLAPMPKPPEPAQPGPAVPPAAEPAGDPAGGAPGGGGSKPGGKAAKLRIHSVEPGKVVGGRHVNINYELRGGFAYGKFDPPKPSGAIVNAIDSDGDIYGPDRIEILIHEVYLDGKQPKIRFEPKIDYRLKSNAVVIPLRKGRVYDVPVRP